MIDFRKAKRYIAPCIAMLILNGYGQSTVTVNVDGASSVIPREIFGLLMERLGKQWSGIFVGTSSTTKNTNGMRQDVIDGFKECGVGLIEWPGGCASNSYNWSNQKNPSNDIGVNRFIQFCQLTGAEPMIAGKPTASDAASNVAFAGYVMDSLKYPLKYFKIGNEVWGCGGSQNEATYQSNYSANYTKFKDNATTKNLFLVAGTDLIGNNTWLSTMVGNIGSQIDGVEIHDYLYFPNSYSSTNPTQTQYWDIVNRANQSQIVPREKGIIQILDQKDPGKRIKIIEDEWGDWLQNTGDGWMQTNTVMDALSAGEQLHVFMSFPERILVACLAQGVSVIHSIININTSGVMAKTPTFYVFKLLIPHHSDNAKLAPITASKIETVTGGSATMPVATVCASVQRDTVNVSFTNVDLTATRKVDVTLTTGKTPSTVKSAEIVTGSTYTSTNDFGAAEQVNIKTLDAASYSLSGKTLSVTLPAKSVVMVRVVVPGLFTSDVVPASIRKKVGEAFSIKAGNKGSVLISSALRERTPALVSLYSLDGKSLLYKTSAVLGAGSKSFVLKGASRDNGVCIVKISGADFSYSKKVVLAQ